MFLPKKLTLSFIKKYSNELTNSEKLFLTDWIITRHLEELSRNKTTSITIEEYENLCILRDSWRTSLSVSNPSIVPLFKTIGKEDVLNKFLNEISSSMPEVIPSLLGDN